MTTNEIRIPNGAPFTPLAGYVLVRSETRRGYDLMTVAAR